MKKLLLIPLFLLCFIEVNAQNYGTFASGVFISPNGVLTTYNVTGSGVNLIGPSSPDFSGSLGSYVNHSGTLILNGAEVKTYKNEGGNVCGGTFYYSIHPVGSAAGYTSLELPFKAGCSNNVFTDGLGPCGGSDQKWSTVANSIDLTAYCPGDYAIDVYYVVPGSNSSSSDCNENLNLGDVGSPIGSMSYTLTGSTPTISGNTNICNGATATLNATGCSGTITWSNGATGDATSVPAGSYTATCTMNGCVSAASNTYEVAEKPATPVPVISGQTKICTGATSILSASGCSGDVSWSNGATEASVTVSAGSYTASCTIDGCVSPASSPYVVIEKPVPSSPVIFGETMVCAGVSSKLTASNCSGDVSWSNGSSDESITVPAGSYTASCTIDGCLSPVSSEYVVTEKPVPATPVISGQTLVCEGATATLTASGCSGDVSWSNGDTGGSITVAAGSYTASCTIDGCESPLSAAYVVTEKPVPAPPTLSGNNSVCPGATTTLVAGNCNGTVTWSTGATGSSIAASAGSYTATCSVDGCPSPASASFLVTQTVVNAPVISGNTTICPGENGTLNASGCNGIVTWSNGATGSTVNLPAGSYTATCTIGASALSAGCVSNPSAPAVITETPVTVPVISGDGSICQGATRPLTVSNCGGTVTWSNGSTGATINATSGIYTATCTMNGCVSAPSAPAVVTTTPVMPPTVVAGATACPAGISTLTASNCAGTVTWSTGATGTSIAAPLGDYSATCTINGCVSTASVPVMVQPCSAPCPATGNLLINGSFEATVAVTNKIGVQLGWTQSGVGNNGLIETWRTPFWNVTAPDGDQLVELNTYALGVLTQDVTVMAGVPMNFSYYHKSRGTFGGERIRAEIVNLTDSTVIQSFESTAGVNWEKFTFTFVPTSTNIQVRMISLSSCNGGPGSGAGGCGNLIDNLVLNYANCQCTSVPDAPTITTTTTTVGTGTNAVLTANGCSGGSIRWSNGQVGTSITTNIPGQYTAQCLMSGNPCISAPSNPVNLNSNGDVSVSCPTFLWKSNGVFHIQFCVTNNGSSPASGSAYFNVNGVLVFTDYYTNLAPGASQCFIFRARYLPCESTVTALVGATLMGTDINPANNTCTGSMLMTCVPNPPPYDPNYKAVSPKRNLEGGIFTTDEWLTYTIHCQNDGPGNAQNVIMVDTIDTSKLDIATIQTISSWDPVQLNYINSNTVSFNFIGVDLTRSAIDLPNSQTEVVFKIKRKPGLQTGAKIENKAEIFFDGNEPVETNYAASMIIQPCDSASTMPGIVTSNAYTTQGANLSETFTLTGYSGVITGWEISTDPTFNSNVQAVANYTNSLSFNAVVNANTFVRALVQTGSCAIVGSKAAAIYTDCANLIQNGSFENPVLTSNTWALKTIPGWTNLADNNTMEIHRNFMGVPTDGSQIVELNGYNFGNIYQDFAVSAGKTIKWKIDHQARAYTNEKITVTLSAPNGTNLSPAVSDIGSTTAWHTVSGSYQIAANQTMVRIRVVSSGGAAAMGNYIDNVRAQYDYCGGTTAMREAEPVAENNFMGEAVSMAVHPNPTQGNANIDLTGFISGTISLDVLNATGQIAKGIKIQYTQGTPLTIDLSGLKAGLYFIKASQGEKTANAKIVKN